MSYLELLKLAVPETVVVLTALVVLAADIFALRGLPLRMRMLLGTMLASVGCGAAIAWLCVVPQQASFVQGMLIASPLISWLKGGILVLTACTLWLSVDTEFTTHAGEYFALVLLAACGMMLLVSCEDILMIFLSLELTSLSLYTLAAFNKRSPQSAEAALKYFLIGGVSAAFTLFGLSLLYGISGATNLSQIAAAIHGPRLDPLVLTAILMTLAGFCFKIAAAPFHLWAPDAYQGAPLPAAALIASGSKLAGFFVLARVTAVGFKGAEGASGWPGHAPGWMVLVAMLAVASMLAGNLAAIVQRSVRRLLAYSAVAHAGYVLLAILAGTPDGVAALVYYVFTYGLTVVGAFCVVGAVQGQGGGDGMSDLAGLSRRSPSLSFCLLVFLLSLAGIPPLAGFFGKFYVFAAALNRPHGLDLLWLVILALALSAVSLYYYLRVLKEVYVADVPSGAAKVEASLRLKVVLWLLAASVVVLGCVPGVITGPLIHALRSG